MLYVNTALFSILLCSGNVLLVRELLDQGEVDKNATGKKNAAMLKTIFPVLNMYKVFTADFTIEADQETKVAA